MEQPMLFECMGNGVLSPAHECEMGASLVYLLIIKYLSHRFCLTAATMYKIGRSCRGIFLGFNFLFFFRERLSMNSFLGIVQ